MLPIQVSAAHYWLLAFEVEMPAQQGLIRDRLDRLGL